MAGCADFSKYQFLHGYPQAQKWRENRNSAPLFRPIRGWRVAVAARLQRGRGLFVAQLWHGRGKMLRGRDRVACQTGRRDRASRPLLQGNTMEDHVHTKRERY